MYLPSTTLLQLHRRTSSGSDPDPSYSQFSFEPVHVAENGNGNGYHDDGIFISDRPMLPAPAEMGPEEACRQKERTYHATINKGSRTQKPNREQQQLRGSQHTQGVHNSQLLKLFNRRADNRKNLPGAFSIKSCHIQVDDITTAEY
ncbi:hypothetical protein HN51_064718 [Arachis hypogaea]